MVMNTQNSEIDLGILFEIIMSSKRNLFQSSS